MTFSRFFAQSKIQRCFLYAEANPKSQTCYDHPVPCVVKTQLVKTANMLRYETFTTAPTVILGSGNRRRGELYEQPLKYNAWNLPHDMAGKVLHALIQRAFVYEIASRSDILQHGGNNIAEHWRWQKWIENAFIAPWQ